MPKSTSSSVRFRTRRPSRREADLKAILSQRSWLPHCSSSAPVSSGCSKLRYVTEDKITCVYIAPNIDLIRAHAKLGGFPADRVLEVATVIDPTTAESNELAATAKV